MSNTNTFLSANMNFSTANSTANMNSSAANSLIGVAAASSRDSINKTSEIPGNARDSSGNARDSSGNAVAVYNHSQHRWVKTKEKKDKVNNSNTIEQHNGQFQQYFDQQLRQQLQQQQEQQQHEEENEFSEVTDVEGIEDFGI